MRTIYLSCGIVWSGPGRSTYLEYGPYLTAAEAEKSTYRTQGQMHTRGVSVPRWFTDLVKDSDFRSRDYLYWEMRRAGWMDNKRVSGERF